LRIGARATSQRCCARLSSLERRGLGLTIAEDEADVRARGGCARGGDRGGKEKRLQHDRGGHRWSCPAQPLELSLWTAGAQIQLDLIMENAFSSS
jgi:hypothetical protein